MLSLSYFSNIKFKDCMQTVKQDKLIIVFYI